ncbi:hypothetical protein [Paenibacillus sp. FSL M7-0896]|uniref:hypothetical protein n=1 Tax=Paenibacillus sp. FSL M7-0896 TaxID=2921610 RepID=UPI0030DA76C4
MKLTRVLKWSIAGIVLCYGIITVAQTLDYLTRQSAYIQQRDRMHQRVEAGQDITESKKITAYLQGRATRGLTAMKSSALYFSAGTGILIAAYWLLKKEDSHVNPGSSTEKVIITAERITPGS